MIKHREIEKILAVIMTSILSISFFYVKKGVDDVIVIFSLILFYIYFFRAISQPIKIVQNIPTNFKIDVFFLLFYFIIYYYPYQLYLLGLYDLYSLTTSYSSYIDYTNHALLLSDIGLICFMTGFNTKKYAKQIKPMTISKKGMGRLSVFFLCMMLITSALFILSGGAIMFIGAYAGSDTGDITSNAIFSLVNLFYILGGLQALYTYYRMKRLSFINVVTLILLSIWTILLLFLGDRNSFFIIAIALAGGFYSFVKGISRIRIAFFVFIGLFLYNVVEVSRTLEDKSISNILENISGDSGKSDDGYGVTSFNTTTIGLRATFQAIDQNGHFFWGKFKVVSLTSLIPYSSRLFFGDEAGYLSSSSVLKSEMIGSNASWGVGTNILSDTYMDFGVFGVIFFMCILGYYAGYIKNSIVRDPLNIKYFFLYILVLGYYAEISRYGVDFPLRTLVWTTIIFNVLQSRQRT